jgi:diaminopimelate epimerase
MLLNFSKYHGAGNDFIIIDNRTKLFTPSIEIVKWLCDRHFGVGADGLMLLEHDTETDFLMRYFNADGLESTMCGNGGRCIAKFASKIGIIDGIACFKGVDGIHKAHIHGDTVSLVMSDVSSAKEVEDGCFFVDTGSPHLVKFVLNIDQIDVNAEGRLLRDSYNVANGGVNVNFVQVTPSGLKIRTYERGVEDETLACGTGAVAASISASLFLELNQSQFMLNALGGVLNVSFQSIGKNTFTNIILKGPVKFVFQGAIEI